MRSHLAAKMVNSPFKWVGGKSRLRKHIISLLPEHSCYLELFSGAAWVLFGKTPSDVEIINDIDQELINFFRVVRERPDDFLAAFEFELVSRAEFDRLAVLDPGELTEIQRARRFYYLIMAAWGGELNYPRIQTSVKDGGHGNRLIGALKYLRERIIPVHNRLKTVIIENLPWEECLTKYDRDGVIMYVDPPYPGNKCNYLHNMRDWEDHRRLAARLATTKCKWILSSYDVPEVRELYEGYRFFPVEAFSGMDATKGGATRVKNRELLILNYEPPAELTPIAHVTRLGEEPEDQPMLELA